MEIKYFKDQSFVGVNKFYYYYYAAIEREQQGEKTHEVLFSAVSNKGINFKQHTFRHPSKECVEISADEFKTAMEKTLQLMLIYFFDNA